MFKGKLIVWGPHCTDSVPLNSSVFKCRSQKHLSKFVGREKILSCAQQESPSFLSKMLLETSVLG